MTTNAVERRCEERPIARASFSPQWTTGGAYRTASGRHDRSMASYGAITKSQSLPTGLTCGPPSV